METVGLRYHLRDYIHTINEVSLIINNKSQQYILNYQQSITLMVTYTIYEMQEIFYNVK